jgi:hypothetical protein
LRIDSVADSDPIAFTRGAADRIANAVRTVEIGNRRSGSIEWETQVPALRKVFRVCTFTGAWDKNTFHVVTFRNITTTPNTTTAYNLFADVNSGDTSASNVNCAIAREGTAWYLIAAEC